MPSRITRTIRSLAAVLVTCATMVTMALADDLVGGFIHRGQRAVGQAGTTVDPFNRNNRLPGYINLGHPDPSQNSYITDPVTPSGPTLQQQQWQKQQQLKQQQWQQQQWQKQQQLKQ